MAGLAADDRQKRSQLEKLKPTLKEKRC